MDPDSLRQTLKIFKAASSGLEKEEKYIMIIILDGSSRIRYTRVKEIIPFFIKIYIYDTAVGVLSPFVDIFLYIYMDGLRVFAFLECKHFKLQKNVQFTYVKNFFPLALFSSSSCA